MADREGRRGSPANLRFTFQIAFTIVLFVLSQQGDHVLSATLVRTSGIRHQLKLTDVCRDYNGVVKSHLDEWPSSAGACDNNICFVAKSANFVIADRCREITSDENPDPENCQKVSNKTRPFPGCCEELQCAESVPLTTISPLLCYDRSKVSSCLYWKSAHNGCIPNTTFYDILKDYCRKTCGICT